MNRTSVFIEFGGTLTNVTSDVLSVQIRRGRSRELDQFTAGNATVTLRNEDRAYDPVNKAGPYYTLIEPRQRIQVLYDDISIFSGIIDDWNIEYGLNNTSTVSVVCVDGLALLAQTTLDTYTNVTETPGQRILKVIERPEVQYSGDALIDSGLNALQADTVSDNANTLDYLNTVSETDVGRLFVDGSGRLRFRDRNDNIAGNPVIVFSDGSSYAQQIELLASAQVWFDAAEPRPVFSDVNAQARWILQDAVLWLDSNDPDYAPPVVPFSDVAVEFGTEFLYNRIAIQRVGGAKVTATVPESITKYGVRSLARDNLLFIDDNSVTEFAEYLADIYGYPAVRVSRHSVLLHGVSHVISRYLSRLEIGDVVRTIWTPSGTGSAFDVDSIIEGIEHRIDNTTHVVTFQLTPRPTGGFILDDEVRGILDQSELTY